MNIGYVLSRITNADYDFFLGMTEEEIKETPPYVLLLWLRGAYRGREARTIMVDLFVNTKIFSLYRHPKLLYMLMCYANEGMGDTKFKFEKDRNNIPKEAKYLMEHLGCSQQVAVQYMKFLSSDDIKLLEKESSERKAKK